MGGDAKDGGPVSVVVARSSHTTLARFRLKILEEIPLPVLALDDEPFEAIDETKVGHRLAAGRRGRVIGSDPDAALCGLGPRNDLADSVPTDDVDYVQAANTAGSGMEVL